MPTITSSQSTPYKLYKATCIWTDCLAGTVKSTRLGLPYIVNVSCSQETCASDGDILLPVFKVKYSMDKPLDL